MTTQSSFTSDSQEVVQFYRAAPSEEPEITLDMFKHRLSEGTTKYGLFHAECDKADLYYNNTYNFEVPDGATKLHLPTYQSSIDSAAARFTGAYMDITAPIRRIGQEDSAEKIERFMHNALATLEERFPFIHRLVSGGLRYGVMGLQVELDTDQYWHLPRYEQMEDEPDEAYVQRVKDAYQELEKRRNTQFPFQAAAIDPRNMLWDMESETPRWIIIRRKVDARWLKANNQNWKGLGSYQGGDVDLYHFWTPTQVASMADNTWVMEPRGHGYGMMPVIIFDMSLSGAIYPRNPDTLYRGMGYGKYELLNTQSKVVSTLIDLLIRNTYPPLLFKGGLAHEARRTMREYQRGPGAHAHVPDGIEVQAAPTPTPPAGIWDALGLVSGLLSSSLYSNIASSPSGAPTESGYHLALQDRASAEILTPVQKGLEHGFRRVCELMLRCVENVIEGPVNTYGNDEFGRDMATIRPSDISGRYSVSISVKASSPNEEERAVNLWSNQIRGGVVDHLTGLRKMNLANVGDILQRLESQKLREHPITQEAFVTWYVQTHLPEIAAAYEQSRTEAQGESPEELARSVLLSQGATQLPNAGNFQQGNQAGIRPNTPGAGIPGSVEQNAPGSLEDINLAQRQAAVNPGLPTNVAGNRLGPPVRL